MTKFRVLLAGVGVVVMSWASGAAAQTTPYVGTEVRGVDVQRPPGSQPASVLSEEITVEESTGEESEGGLPVTGGDLAGLALIGAGAIAVGSALHFRRRRPMAFVAATPDATGRY